MIGLEEAVVTAGRRLEVAWPARKWTPDLRREYSEALRAIGDTEAIREGVTAAVRGWGGNFPPPVASLCELVWDAQRQRLERERERIREAERARMGEYQVAPAWWARLTMGAILHSAHSRGIATPAPERTERYRQIAVQHGVTPKDLGERLDGSDAAQNVRDAIAEAKAYGERVGDDREADHRELGDLPTPTPIASGFSGKP